ncbi:valine--tRNA ligase [Candidatus Aminicenantes bacterium AC-335-A11]|jgi:valyl-tRNA synthetase|nr:valine--tRNA ligase [SCandidatus Aminicenantes bacterium Aminicenantia_JdfR_composite]MCP2598643.1 valine--tRNA ligase [Candidatus Aminicenantes bacterium AC-335-L06]MCP2618538.1 valine--tRNA ligase [Candidatus Aminicenantes bacterium AC-335-A11]
MKEPLILPKVYSPKEVEEKWIKFWEEKELYVADVNSEKPKFSMVLPPPNVTGSLHMGHALCFTLPDIIARWKRMQGFNVMWLPGTDHASIAVHNVIEKELSKKGISRKDLGREKFLKIAWEWKEKYGGIIVNQLKKLGASLDWSRERFTMDKGFTKAVRKVFVDLYKSNLIYRGYYLVNRCPRCETVLSDIEVVHKEVKAKLYYIKYPIVDSDEFIVVATTRPETMLGDTAVAVHPDDKRYKKFRNKKAILPLVERIIPIIEDKKVDMEFGTGAVKVTPAHDPVDFEIGKRHNLEQVIVIDGRGRMTKEAGKEFEGLDRFECRKKVIEKLREKNLIQKIEDYTHNVGHCYRCDTIIEPHLSWQWFVKVKPLAEEAIKVVKKGRIKFIPPNWAKTYFEWMYNIHDWCISRQLWWGHRIPAWYCSNCGEIIVEMEDPKSCSKCGSSEIHQDEDILDTWFSSALWPFATMGWPEETPDLKKFYPTDLLVTGFDIIFFWVARMIMMGLKFAGDIPFREVFINGLVRDFKKQKMSKSKGNIIDPLEMIEKYGTDALRFTLAALAVPGMDISLSEERMAGYRAFANKIWNASRFVLMNYKGEELEIKEEELTFPDKWIRSRFNQIVKEINQSLKEYKFYEASEKIYHFIWHEFCDWYIELVKLDLKRGNKTSLSVLVKTLDGILRILHPFMPFITEEIWQKLPHKEISISIASFPKYIPSLENKDAERKMEKIKKLIIAVRTLRAEHRIDPKKKIDVWINIPQKKDRELVENNIEYIKILTNAEKIEFKDLFPSEERFIRNIANNWEVAIPVKGILDWKKEISRINKEIEKTEDEISKLEMRLNNPQFIEKAPPEIVTQTENRLSELKEKLIKLKKSLSDISIS